MVITQTLAGECPVCAATRSSHWGTLPGEAEIFRCLECRCDFARWCNAPASSAAKATTAPDHFHNIDHQQYLRSVGATRKRSFGGWLQRVRRHAHGGPWLDVGCSYGWLLQLLRRTEFEGYGVEPSAGAAQAAQADGLHVQQGLFPHCAGEGAPYSVISFFDVLEHFTHPGAMLEQARQLLRPAGLLAIQVPDQSCLLYRLAEGLHRGSGRRIAFALRRLWLAGFDFPHQTYFNAAALRLLLERSGFEVLELVREPIGSPGESLSRVGYAQPGRRLANLAVGLAVGGIQACDSLTGFGGLLCAVAKLASPTVEVPSFAAELMS